MGDWVINESSYKYLYTAEEESRKEISEKSNNVICGMKEKGEARQQADRQRELEITYGQ